VELTKDYYCVIDYHSRKMNIIIDALNHKNKARVDELLECDKRELIELNSINAQL
jgi:hypothetical protein